MDNKASRFRKLGTNAEQSSCKTIWGFHSISLSKVLSLATTYRLTLVLFPCTEMARENIIILYLSNGSRLKKSSVGTISPNNLHLT